jgi:hypothetical protein
MSIGILHATSYPLEVTGHYYVCLIVTKNRNYYPDLDIILDFIYNIKDKSHLDPGLSYIVCYIN